MAQGPQDTFLFMLSEPSKALLPQTTMQEQHLGSVKVRLCSYNFQSICAILANEKRHSTNNYLS